MRPVASLLTRFSAAYGFHGKGLRFRVQGLGWFKVVYVTTGYPVRVPSPVFVISVSLRVLV